MRRLPPWMIAGGSSGVTTPSNRSDDKSVEVKSKHEPVVPKTKAEKRPRRTLKLKEGDNSEEQKKVGIKRKGGERCRSKVGEEEAKDPEITQSVIGLADEDLTVDDLLSFAKEYVESEEQTSKDRESLSISSKSMVVTDDSNLKSSQGGTHEPNETKDPIPEDMLGLLLGPFFTKSRAI